MTSPAVNTARVSGDDGPWPAAGFAAPFYDAVRADLAAFVAFPNVAELSALANERNLQAANGVALRFLEADATGRQADGLGIVDNPYELRVHDEGAIETRPGNWHDLFNALSWLAWPKAKAALNALHVRELLSAADRTRRGAARDVATLFDEGGAVVAVSDPLFADLADLLRGMRWRHLFVARRADVVRHLRCFVFGHALLDKARDPYKAMTAHALLLPVPPDFHPLPVARQVALLDARVAEWLADPSNLVSAAQLGPLPLLGLPGYCEANLKPAFYDDAQVFRPARLRITQ
jgi:DUF3025 family protein